MPTKVQNRPSESIPHGPVHDSFHEHDPANVNKNIQHREALRLALGSILTPKRTYTPSSHSHSHSSSGTASPAYPFSFPTSPPMQSSSHLTASQGQGASRSETHLHPHYLHPHSHSHPHPTSLPHLHPHTPSRLGLSDMSDYGFSHPHSSATGSPNASPPSSVAFSNAASQPPSPSLESIPPLPAAAMSESHDQAGGTSTVPAIHAPAPVQASLGSEVVNATSSHPQSTSGEEGSDSGSGTPKAKFIETLQSKSAWDALIHGSFS